MSGALTVGRLPRDLVRRCGGVGVSVNPEHYVRPGGGDDGKCNSINAWSRFARRLGSFFFDKKRDDTPPGIFPTRDSTRMAAVTAEPPALIHTDPSDSDLYGLDA